MSAKYLKQGNSQQKNKYNQTWSTLNDRDVNSCCNSLSKKPRPERRITQHEPTLEHDLQYEGNQKNDQSREEKHEGHRRQHSGCHKKNQTKDKETLIYYPERTLQSQNFIPQPFYTSKNNAVNSSQDIETRFQEIESIMGVENDNLREQKEYLLKTIQKMQLKEKEYKKELKSQENKILMLESENRILRDKYEKAKDFISHGIGKIEHEIKEQIENNETQNTNCKSNESSMNTTAQMEELNERFEVMMFEYQKTKEPEIRRKCVEIAKELKKLKKLRNSRTASQEKSISKPPAIPKSPKISSQISKKLYEY